MFNTNHSTRRGALSSLGAASLLGFGGFAGAGILAGCRAAPVTASVPRTIFGVNMAWLLLGQADHGEKSSLDALKALGRLGIPFARFAASGQWAADWARFEANPKLHWDALDRIFATAADNGVQLIPSVLWHASVIALHCGEPMQAWTNAASRTRMLAHSYTQTFVERYDHSPALLMYEFANEMNDWVDLPNVLSFWPEHDPTLPYRLRVEQDRLSSVQMRDFVGAFGSTIRLFSTKPIAMGSNMPRANAWHLARGSWETDTPTEFIEQFRALTPPELNVLSFHIYDSSYGKSDSIFSNLPDLLKALTQGAALDNRMTLLGEFGVQRMPDTQEERRSFNDMMNAIRNSNVRYAALWNFSLEKFQPTWDVSPNGDRAYQLDAIRLANQHPPSDK